MPTAPKTTPESASDNGLSRVHFTHRGRRMTIFKQQPGIEAPWYIHFEVNKRRHKKCLETNVKRSAVERAKDHFDAVVEERWHPRERAGNTLEDVLKVYRVHAGVAPTTIRYNIWAMQHVLETCGLPSDPKAVRLNKITGALNSEFQLKTVESYLEGVRGDNAIREARERALRSSRSILSQARSLFKKRGHLREAYATASVVLPKSVDEFATAKRLGRSTKREYLAPPDTVVQEAFAAVDGLQKADPDLFLAFWFAAGAGLRRGEVMRLDWSHVVDRDGHMWISGGIGKNGEVIDVPVQTLAAGKIAPLRRTNGKVLTNKNKAVRRLNAWMRGRGWKTEKKMHELRAYVGSLIYHVNPMAAMRFMRHKSIRITESFYVRYGKAALPVDVLQPVPVREEPGSPKDGPVNRDSSSAKQPSGPELPPDGCPSEGAAVAPASGCASPQGSD